MQANFLFASSALECKKDKELFLANFAYYTSGTKQKHR